MIRLAVFDIDRTLIPPSTGILASETLDALLELKRKGVYIVIASGRQRQFLPQALREVDFDYYILSNGAYAMDGQGNTLYQEGIPNDTIRKLTEDIIKHDLPMDVRYLRGFCSVNPRQHFANFLGQIAGKKTQEEFENHVSMIPNPGESAISAVAVIPQNVFSYFQKTYPQLDFLPIFGLSLYDINKAGISKATGLKHICSRLGIPMSETIAFGDDRNDLEMIRAAGIGVAMGEGIAETKEAADYITDTSDNLGVVKGLRHYHLLD